MEYRITYRGVQTPNAVDIANFTSPSMLRIGPVTSFNLVDGLMPGSSYEIFVEAATSVGFGPSSNTIVAVTAESGECMHIQWSTVNSSWHMQHDTECVI